MYLQFSIMMVHAAIRILINVSCLGVDDGLDKRLEIVILRQKLVQMGELVTRVAKPLGPIPSIQHSEISIWSMAAGCMTRLKCKPT